MAQSHLKLLLNTAGLSKKEAQVYLYLLEAGPSKAAKVIKELEIKRGSAYGLLNSLIKKGFVLKKGTIFVPQHPRTIVQSLKEKAEKIKTAIDSFDSLGPELTSMYKLAVGKPTIKYYEGKQGLVEVFKDIYSPKDEPVYGAINVDQIESVFENLSEGKLIPSRLKSGLQVKVLFNDTELARKLHQKDKQQKRESIILDQDKYPLPAEIEAYEDKVALMSFKQGDFLGLIIENEDFAITLRSILKFLFDHLRSCQDFKKRLK